MKVYEPICEKKHAKLYVMYLFCMEYHCGQWSRIYRLGCYLFRKLSRIECQSRVTPIIDYSETAKKLIDSNPKYKAFYNQLVKKYGDEV